MSGEFDTSIFEKPQNSIFAHKLHNFALGLLTAFHNGRQLAIPFFAYQFKVKFGFELRAKGGNGDRT